MLTQLTRFASLLDVQLDAVEMELRATFPQEGKYGLVEGGGSAMEELTYVVDIKSPASEEQVAEAMAKAEQFCHAANSLRVPVQIVPMLRVNGADVPFTPPEPPELQRHHG